MTATLIVTPYSVDEDHPRRWMLYSFPCPVDWVGLRMPDKMFFDIGIIHISKASTPSSADHSSSTDEMSNQVHGCETDDGTYLTVFFSVVATSVFALFKTFWNSETRCLILECI